MDPDIYLEIINIKNTEFCTDEKRERKLKAGEVRTVRSHTKIYI